MSIFRRPNKNISEEREYENMAAAVAKQAALVEYIAVMTDCEEILELEEEETEEENEEDEDE